MKLIKKINNNFALAHDSQGEEVIVSGRGIGFIKMPCIITDLSMITRTYYDIDSKYIGLLNEIPENILNISVKIVDYAKNKLKNRLNPNLIFTLADHIHFSIERYKKHIVFEFSLTYDFEQLYSKEIQIGKYALKLMEEQLNIQLPKTEVLGIAMNIINSELYSSIPNNEQDFNELIKHMTVIIENYFHMTIDQTTVNYSRFATHLRYLFKRISQDKTISSDNLKIFQSLQKETPETYQCVYQMSCYLNRKKNWKLDEEELLYLILHVNRLLTREDCNQKGITSDT